MSSIPAKKTIRTYSRQKRSLYEEPPAKRRRVECTLRSTIDEVCEPKISQIDADSSVKSDTPEPPTSSPKISSAIWSDEAPKSSPPSSPVPNSSPPPLQRRRSAFSFLKKSSKSGPFSKKPLSEGQHNVQSSQKPPQQKRRMVQMQLDLASETRKACKTCGMEYIPSNAEDAALHKKFHAMNMGGVDFTKSTVERLRKTQVWSGGDGSFIAVVGRKDALALRNRTSDVLKVVNTELAAVPISDEELWSQTAQPKSSDEQSSTSKGTTTGVATVNAKSPSVDRFKMYLYVKAQKCIGVCLAERIWEAYNVLDQCDTGVQGQSCPTLGETQSSSISISTSSSPAILGISRIWTSNQQRKQGIATRLLDCARASFLYGLVIEKGQIAFSQPTESGGKLARKWFGRDAGWGVYID